MIIINGDDYTCSKCKRTFDAIVFEISTNRYYCDGGNCKNLISQEEVTELFLLGWERSRFAYNEVYEFIFSPSRKGVDN